MGDLNLTTTRPKITIAVTDDAGEEHTHTFEVLPLTKPRYEEVVKFARRGRELEEGEELEAMAPMVAAFCDKLVRSTNGPVTITELWDDGVLPFAWVVRVARHLQQEAVGDPPA